MPKNHTEQPNNNILVTYKTLAANLAQAKNIHYNSIWTKHYVYTIWFIYISEAPNTHQIKCLWKRQTFHIKVYFLRRLLKFTLGSFFPNPAQNVGFQLTQENKHARESVVHSTGLSGDEVCLQSFHSGRTKRAKVGRGVKQVLWVAREFNPTTEHPKDHKGRSERESTVTGTQVPWVAPQTVCVCV